MEAIDKKDDVFKDGVFFIVKKKDNKFQLDSEGIPVFDNALEEARKRTIENGAEYGVVGLIDLFQKVVSAKSIIHNGESN